MILILVDMLFVYPFWFTNGFLSEPLNQNEKLI
jgi:hypothetical protein